MRPALLPLALLAAAVAVAGCSPIRDRMYFPPPEPVSADGMPAGVSVVRVTTRDGLALAGLAVPGQADRPVLLVFHGNASSAGSTIRWLAPSIAAGYGVVAAEYRGYGGNPGRASERGLAADADAFYTQAQQLAGSRPVIVVGHSLGGGVAFGLAGRQRLDALVTVGTFTGMRAMAPRFARALIADRYDNLAAVPALTAPLYLIHGSADDVVPAQMGTALHAAAVEAGRTGATYAIAGADHHPDGALVGRVIDVIVARLAKRPVPALPAGVSEHPFGS